MTTGGIIVVLSLALLAVVTTVAVVDTLRRHRWTHPPDGDGIREDEFDDEP